MAKRQSNTQASTGSIGAAVAAVLAEQAQAMEATSKAQKAIKGGSLLDTIRKNALADATLLNNTQGVILAQETARKNILIERGKQYVDVTITPYAKSKKGESIQALNPASMFYIRELTADMMKLRGETKPLDYTRHVQSTASTIMGAINGAAYFQHHGGKVEVIEVHETTDDKGKTVKTDVPTVVTDAVAYLSKQPNMLAVLKVSRAIKAASGFEASSRGDEVKAVNLSTLNGILAKLHKRLNLDCVMAINDWLVSEVRSTGAAGMPMIPEGNKVFLDTHAADWKLALHKAMTEKQTPVPVTGNVAALGLPPTLAKPEAPKQRTQRRKAA